MFVVAGGGLDNSTLYYFPLGYILFLICCYSALYALYYTSFYTTREYLRILVFAKKILCFAKIRQKYLTFVTTKICVFFGMCK